MHFDFSLHLTANNRQASAMVSSAQVEAELSAMKAPIADNEGVRVSR
jgi:hypothetical protein